MSLLNGGAIHLDTVDFLSMGFLQEPNHAEPKKLRRKINHGINALLSNLETTHEQIIQLVKYEPHALLLARKIGVYVHTPDVTGPDAFTSNTLELLGGEGLPTEMACTFNIGNQDENLVPSLFYARKAKWWKGAQYVRGCETYQFGAVYFYNDRPHVINSHVSVNKKTGKVTALKEKTTRQIEIPRGRHGRRIISKDEWGHPPLMLDGKWTDSEKQSANAAVELFCLLYNVHSRRSMGIAVTASRNGNRMVFTVPEHEWKDFFRERIGAKTTTGRKCNIFHWVKAHTRNTHKGLRSINTHFRGQRDFIWGDYSVLISVPGIHGAGMNSVQFTPKDESDNTNAHNSVELNEKLADRIRDVAVY